MKYEDIKVGGIYRDSGYPDIHLEVTDANREWVHFKTIGPSPEMGASLGIRRWDTPSFCEWCALVYTVEGFEV